MKTILAAFVGVCLTTTVLAQQQSPEAYRKVLTDRSAKIVNTLGITDSVQYKRVLDLVVDHYATVGRIHDTADSTVKVLKVAGLEKEELAEKVLAFQHERDAKLYDHHAAFTAGLQGELTPDQVEAVKNGLTYNVLNVTYTAQLDMIPTLKDDEKRQIRIWLLEAREHAIDAPSADAKHGWFGKYKGRINNYLAKKGYDLTKERAAWAERIKQKQAEPTK